MDQTGQQPIVDAGVPIVPGTGIVLRFHPLTLVVAPDADTDRTASAASDVVTELHDKGTFDFGPVAAALQGLVVAEQPRGVAAVIDGESPIIFLFDQAVAEGDKQRHQSQGRAGWTTAYANDATLLLTVGSPRSDAEPVSWSRLTQGIVVGDGAFVQLGLPAPAPLATATLSNQAETTEPEPATADDESTVASTTATATANGAAVGYGSVADGNATKDGAAKDDDLETVVASTSAGADDDIEVGNTLGVDAVAGVASDEVAAQSTPQEPTDEPDPGAEAEEVVEAINRDDLRRQIATASLASDPNARQTTPDGTASAATNPASAATNPASAADDATVTASDETDAVDATVTEVLDPAELGLAVSATDRHDDAHVAEADGQEPPADALPDITSTTPDVEIDPTADRPVDETISMAVPGPPPSPDTPPANPQPAAPDSGRRVIAGPPPMPGPRDIVGVAAPSVIAGPPPMPGSAPSPVSGRTAGQAVSTTANQEVGNLVDVTDPNSTTIVLTDPLAAAGPEPNEHVGAETERAVIAGPPPMPEGPPSPDNA